jgi:hypothetical protein
MSVSIKSFQRPKGTAMSFTKRGDFIDGTVFDAAMIDDIHNVGGEVLQIKINVLEAVVDGEAVEVPEDIDLLMDIYARAVGMQDALGEAVGKAERESIDVGARLRVEFVGEKVLPRTGRSMKLYAAEYRPAGPIGSATVGDDEPAPF